MEARKRRSRMRRVSSGKRIELTERDIDLFKLLSRYRYLRSNYLYAFLGGHSETRFKERLGHLYHDGRYINRPERQWQFAKARYAPAAYELDDRGEQVLREQGLAQADSPLLAKGRCGAYRQFAHQLMVCECMASIELGARQNAGLRFISWQEIMARAPEETRQMRNPFELPVSVSYPWPRSEQPLRADLKVIPDGLFGLEYTQIGQKTYRFFALEADRATMPVRRSDMAQSSYLRKILGYQEVIRANVHKSQLGIPNLFVLTVTTNASHLTNIMTLANELMPSGKSKLFLFKHTGDMPEQGRLRLSLNEPWQRVGYDALGIDEQ